MLGSFQMACGNITVLLHRLGGRPSLENTGKINNLSRHSYTMIVFMLACGVLWGHSKLGKSKSCVANYRISEISSNLSQTQGTHL